jgi:hypothetical protein
LPISPAAAHPDHSMLLHLREERRLRTRSYVQAQKIVEVHVNHLESYSRGRCIFTDASLQDMIHMSGFTLQPPYPGNDLQITSTARSSLPRPNHTSVTGDDYIHPNHRSVAHTFASKTTSAHGSVPHHGFFTGVPDFKPGVSSFEAWTAMRHPSTFSRPVPTPPSRPTSSRPRRIKHTAPSAINDDYWVRRLDAEAAAQMARLSAPQRDSPEAPRPRRWRGFLLVLTVLFLFLYYRESTERDTLTLSDGRDETL